MSKHRFSSWLLISTLLLAGCFKQPMNLKNMPVAQDKQDKLAQDKAVSNEKKEIHPALKDPSKADKQAPEVFRVRFETTKGDFVVEVTREWSPNGADRFYNLVDIGYFEDTAIFRAIKGFMFQFGIHGNSAINEVWRDANIPDDKGKGISNKPGTLTFAHAGPNTRGTQLFINLGNNNSLDRDFTPIGKVVEGLDVVSKINTEYGENSGEVQARFQAQGNAYITKRYPNIDFIKSVKLVEAADAAKASGEQEDGGEPKASGESKDESNDKGKG